MVVTVVISGATTYEGTSGPPSMCGEVIGKPREMPAAPAKCFSEKSEVTPGPL